MDYGGCSRNWFSDCPNSGDNKNKFDTERKI